MTLLDVCSKLSIDVSDDLTDDQLEERIVNHGSSLLKQVEELKKKEPEPKKKNPPKFGEGIINMLVSGRTGDIDNLVNEGKVTPAVADKLKEQFTGRENILTRVDEEGLGIDDFDKVIAALKENETVVNYGGKNKKKLEKKSDEVNPLIADAETRAKAGR